MLYAFMVSCAIILVLLSYIFSLKNDIYYLKAEVQHFKDKSNRLLKEKQYK